MLPLIQNEVLSNNWLSMEELIAFLLYISSKKIHPIVVILISAIIGIGKYFLIPLCTS